jgi:hypothetical protein
VIIKVGETYAMRDGRHVRIVEDTGQAGSNQFRGVTETGALTWRSRAGKLMHRPHPGDLVGKADLRGWSEPDLVYFSDLGRAAPRRDRNHSF